MDYNGYTVVAQNGNKKLLMCEQEQEEDFMVVGATEDEIKENFPGYVPDKYDLYLNKYLIVENGVTHVKGPDGVDITKDLYGEDVFEK